VLCGESGTGKELIAELIHRESRREGPFVPVNCAALPEALVDSLLFGHRRGAFTGATEGSTGLVVSAHGGTLFLDEIAELPLSVQAKLLRVLQQGAVLPMGETRERPVDLRIVAASHQDLRAAVSAGRFREDLYFRMAKFEIHLPPLRERGRDVILIARHYLERAADLRGRARLGRTTDVELVRYTWPGNVRELQNVLFRVALRTRGAITGRDLRLALGLPDAPPPVDASVRVVELVTASGEVNCPDLSLAVGIPRSTLGRLLRTLVDAGELVAIGQGKATRYRRPVPGELPLDERCRMALAIAQRDGRITRMTLSDRSGLPPRTASRVLAQLLECGLLVPDGRQGSSAGYMLPVDLTP
jgi:DNA-binding NtrC family response regulator